MQNSPKKYSFAAAILAGGKGRRMGNKYKQFIRVEGKPILFYSLEKFIPCDFLKIIVIAVPADKLQYAKNLIQKNFSDPRIRVVVGGKTREESSYKVLEHLHSESPNIDYVIIHDAARPLISEEMIRAVAFGAVKFGAAVLGLKSLETVVETKNEFIKKIPERALTYYTFTPHCFKFNWLWKAHNYASPREKEKHDLELFFDSGKKINIIDNFPPKRGENPALKITYFPDLEILKELL